MKIKLQNSHGDEKYSTGNGIAKKLTHMTREHLPVWRLPEGVGGAGWRGATGKIRTTVVA